MQVDGDTTIDPYQCMLTGIPDCRKATMDENPLINEVVAREEQMEIPQVDALLRLVHECNQLVVLLVDGQ